MKKFLILVFMFIIVSVYADDLLDVPPSIQGVWHCIAMSSDKGKTTTNGQGMSFLRMYSTKVVMNDSDRTTRSINRIQVIKKDDTYFLILHPAGLDSAWIISDKGNGTILVQIWNKNTDKETSRMLFSIEH